MWKFRVKLGEKKRLRQVKFYCFINVGKLIQSQTLTRGLIQTDWPWNRQTECVFKGQMCLQSVCEESSRQSGSFRPCINILPRNEKQQQPVGKHREKSQTTSAELSTAQLMNKFPFIIQGQNSIRVNRRAQQHNQNLKNRKTILYNTKQFLMPCRHISNHLLGLVFGWMISGFEHYGALIIW